MRLITELLDKQKRLESSQGIIIYLNACIILMKYFTIYYML